MYRLNEWRNPSRPGTGYLRLCGLLFLVWASRAGGEDWSEDAGEREISEPAFLDDETKDMHQHRYCPPGCLRYSTDGCNSCNCDSDGFIITCTRRFCYTQGAPQCLKFGIETTTPSTTSTTTLTTTSPPVTTVPGRSPYPPCPADCRVFRPDGCNECFCSAAGVTLWCSEMMCTTQETPTQICAEFLDGRRMPPVTTTTTTSVTEMPSSTSTSPPVTSLPADSTEPLTTLPPSAEVTPPQTTTTAPITTVDETTTEEPSRVPQLCNAQGPEGSKSLTCPSRCSLALLGCQVCSCAADGSGVEWCSPCIERCTKFRSVCLDISGSRNNRPSPATQNVSANISRLEIDIQISNHVNQATGSAHCTGDCDIRLQREAADPPRLRRHPLQAAAESQAPVGGLSCSKLVQLNAVGAVSASESCAAVDMGCLVCDCNTMGDTISDCWLKSDDQRCLTSMTISEPKCLADKHVLHGQLTHIPLSAFIPGDVPHIPSIHHIEKEIHKIESDPAGELLKEGLKIVPKLEGQHPTWLAKLNHQIVNSELWAQVKRLYHKFMFSLNEDELADN